MNRSKNLLVGAAAALGVAGAVTSAEAVTTFSTATGAIAFLGSPKVTIAAPDGMAKFNTTILLIFGATGDLGSTTGPGTAIGTIQWSDTVGVTLPEPITDFISLKDSPTGTFKFDVTSVETTGYSVTPTSTSISLYLLGDTYGGYKNYLPGPTSVTLQINKTGKSAYSAAATLAAPPAAAPEPASWAMMLTGFGLSGAVMRRRSRMQVAV
jgi:hypothetical protein